MEQIIEPAPVSEEEEVEAEVATEAEPEEEAKSESEEEPEEEPSKLPTRVKAKSTTAQPELLLDGGPRGKFEGEAPNLVDGEDLDIPPFLRKKR